MNRPLTICASLTILALAACGNPEAPGHIAEDDGAPRVATVQAPDGLTLTYETRGTGDTTVLLIHCWTCDREFWREQVDALAQDYRVVTLDLGGHGESPGERESWRVLDYGADVQAVADALELQRVVLVGHSMGGPVALEAARRLGQRALGVICVDTLHDADFEFPEEMAQQWIAGLEQDFEAAMAEAMGGMAASGIDPAVRDWIVQRAIAASPEMAVGLMRDFLTLDLPQMFRDAGAPIRCVNAAPPAVPPTNVEGNRRYADYDAVILEGVGHFIQLERPEEFNAQLREFVAGFESDSR